jgi:uncharacterized protein YfbU (UPF0304 family)
MKAPIKLTPELQQYFECRMMELKAIFMHTPFDQLEAEFVDKLKSIFEDGGAFLKKDIMNQLDEMIEPITEYVVDIRDFRKAIEATNVNSIIEKMSKANKK